MFGNTKLVKKFPLKHHTGMVVNDGEFMIRLLILALWNALSPRVVKFNGVVKVRLVLPQPLNALLPILTTESGILILFKTLHPLNAELPIAVTPFGMLIEDRTTQPVNALEPIFVTLLGMFILAS